MKEKVKKEDKKTNARKQKLEKLVIVHKVYFSNKFSSRAEHCHTVNRVKKTWPQRS